MRRRSSFHHRGLLVSFVILLCRTHDSSCEQNTMHLGVCVCGCDNKAAQDASRLFTGTNTRKQTHAHTLPDLLRAERVMSTMRRTPPAARTTEHKCNNPKKSHHSSGARLAVVGARVWLQPTCVHRIRTSSFWHIDVWRQTYDIQERRLFVGSRN